MRQSHTVIRPAQPDLAAPAFPASAFPAPLYADAGESTPKVDIGFPPPPAILDLTRGDAAPMALTTVRIADARQLDIDAFVAAVSDAYRSIWRDVSTSAHPHIVRLWNGVPGIHDRVDAARDRYMIFNAGRYAAMREWFGSDADLALNAPAASGVGIDGDDLLIHALASVNPGTAIQNPRQTPAAHYSRRYGPLPPCFARATRVTLAGRPTLLVSGTAAILGEDSMHTHDLGRQLALTLGNLAGVLGAGIASPTAAYESLRIYLPDLGLRSMVETALWQTFGRECAMEFVPAELCRRELLVEIEGIAVDRA